MKWLITRSPEACEAWQAELNADGINLVGISFLEFQMIPITEFPTCDWVFFTSKNGVKYFFDQWEKPISCKIAAIGKATAEAIKTRSYIPDYIPEGHINSALNVFNTIATNQTIAWVKALNSAMSVEEKLKDVKSITPVVVYENKIAAKQLNEAFDGVVFTSPMNVEGFLVHNQIKHGNLIISIGPSTSKCLKDNGIHEFHEMELAEMKYIVQKIKSLKGINP